MRPSVVLLSLALALPGMPRAAEGPLLGTYGPTRAGDTFWNVAERLQAGRDAGLIRLHRRLIRDNPDAYLDGDPDRLRIGVMLEIRGPVSMVPQGWPAAASAVAVPIPDVAAAGPAQDDRASSDAPARFDAHAPADSMAASAAHAPHDDMASSDAAARFDAHAPADSMAASATHAPHDDMAPSDTAERVDAHAPADAMAASAPREEGASSGTAQLGGPASADPMATPASAP